MQTPILMYGVLDGLHHKDRKYNFHVAIIL